MDLVIFGMGQFGSALAQIFKKQGLRVSAVTRSHSGFPKNYNFSKSVALLCVPTQSLPELVAQRGDDLRKFFAIVSTAKGLIEANGLPPSPFLRNSLAGQDIFALSGPSFASELKSGMPTALVLAGKNKKKLNELTDLLTTKQLRLYKSTDPLGVELAGALKNVYALAAGMSDGLGFADNTRAALTTRALAELDRIGCALGGKSQTFFGLAGMGDLFLTCNSKKSRNYRFGLGLAQGHSAKSLHANLGTVEGPWTVAVAKKLCQKKKLRAPLLDVVNEIINKNLPVKRALKKLMNRKVRHEFD